MLSSGSASIKATALIYSKNVDLSELSFKQHGPCPVQIGRDLANLKRMESKFDVFWHIYWWNRRRI